MSTTQTALVRVGVIGAGKIGQMHSDLLMRRVPGATVAAIHDVRPEAARKVADGLGVEPAGEASELISAEDIDAVAICTNTETHADLIVAAAEAGKAIFCEKPVSLDLREVDRALAAVAEAGIPFQIGFNRRFDPSHAAVAMAVADGTVGDPHLVRITSRDPAPPPLEYVRTSGGLFLDMTVHDFDMARFVSGSEVVEVSAHGTVRVNPEFATVGDVDTAVVTMTHENGCLTTVDNSRQAVYGYDQRVEVLGSAGLVASDNPLQNTVTLRTHAGARSGTLPFFYLNRYIPSYVREWESFVAAVNAGRTPVVTSVDARASLVLGIAAWRSLHERRPVRVEEVQAA